MNYKKIPALFVLCFMFLSGSAQSNRWQQRVKYTMDVDLNIVTNRFAGKQKLEYTNNSPDKLNRVFYHLYWNAFQPNSSMDIRSQELGKTLVFGKPDWDSRVKDRISRLKEDEIGFQKIKSLKMNGVPQEFVYHETILEVKLSKPILPSSTVVFEMEFEAQVPLQVRRSGRDNQQTGVRYSMSQWYPKMCEYDYMGWHPTPYVAREFYGVWGDFDVHITLDKDYKIGGTGVLMNAAAIGWGYDTPGTELKPTTSAKRSWFFSAKNVHDFVWAADPDFRHIVKKTPTTILHVIYNFKPGNLKNDSAWQLVADAAEKVLPFIERNFGKYPYPQYSFIQGGDGGMEYPMATLIFGPSLGAVFHEWMHSWYQMMLATNESLYPWMDEGFASYAEAMVTNYYYKRNSLQDYRERFADKPNDGLKSLIDMLPENHSEAYEGYFALVKSGMEEPLTTHADHFNTNFAYSIASYSKGEIFLEQLGYIVGAEMRDKILLAYYKEWRFRHPDANDFIRLAQMVSGIQLDWYKEYWVNGTKTIDYGIDSVWQAGDLTKIRLSRMGKMPMPVDVEVIYNDGTTEMHYVPLNIMYGNKQKENNEPWFVEPEWKWTHPTYELEIRRKLSDIKSVEIDPSKRMADINRVNNKLLPQ